MTTNNDNDLEKLLQQEQGQDQVQKRSQVRKVETMWKKIRGWILASIAFIAGAFIRGVVPASGNSGQQGVVSATPALTPPTQPESPLQGQIVPTVQMEIEGNTYLVNSNDQRITLEKNVTERYIGGGQVIETFAEQRTTIEPAGMSAPFNPVPAAAGDLTMDKILTTVSSFAVLATNLLLLVKAKKDLSGPKSSPVIFVSVGDRTGFFITHNSDVKEVEENLKGTFHQGQVTIYHNVEIVEEDDRKGTGRKDSGG